MGPTWNSSQCLTQMVPPIKACPCEDFCEDDISGEITSLRNLQGTNFFISIIHHQGDSHGWRFTQRERESCLSRSSSLLLGDLGQRPIILWFLSFVLQYHDCPLVQLWACFLSVWVAWIGLALPINSDHEICFIFLGAPLMILRLMV